MLASSAAIEQVVELMWAGYTSARWQATPATVRKIAPHIRINH
jgi:hypothetical protein